MGTAESVQCVRVSAETDEQYNARCAETNALRKLEARLVALGYNLDELDKDSPYYVELA